MTDTANRILWIVVGAVLTVAGAAGVLIYMDRFPLVGADNRLLGSDVIAWWHRGDGWNLFVVMAAGVLLALVGLWLFGRQLRSRGGRRMGDIPIATKSDNAGKTTLRATGLVHALDADLASDAGVRRATVEFTGSGESPRLWIWIDSADGAMVDKIHKHVTNCLERFTTTSGITPAGVDVTVRPDSHAQQRVH